MISQNLLWIIFINVIIETYIYIIIGSLVQNKSGIA